MAERLPRLFGKYVLLKSLARGGMGEIYLAASDQGGGFSKLCVIKKIIAEKADQSKVNRFLDEAKVVLRLSHANLVPTFDAGDVSGDLYIAMELVEGKDLREIWNRCVRTRTRIPLDVALQVVRETARALAYVHGYGDLRLVHRDVAPPNILLSYYGEVKLTDFGLARSAIKQEHTAPGVVFGRASYLAPEQGRGEVADGRTDVYSLGIVLWELLTGQPYLQLAGLDPVTSLSLVRNPKAVPPSTQAPWIAPELDALVLRALASDRMKRFQSAEEMRRALSEVMARVAPRADAERVAEFMKGLYHEVRLDEQAEREHLLTTVLPRWRGEDPEGALTPTTNVLSLASAAFGAQAAASAAGSPVTPRGSAPARTMTEPSGAPPEMVAAATVQTRDTVVARVAEPGAETLHASALRVRNVSGARRRTPSDGSGADTKVWRPGRRRGADGPGPGSGPGPDAEEDQTDADAAGETEGGAPAGAPASVGKTFVGRVIENRYRIRNRIGAGGMGTVYRAEHVEIGKSVAVKILRRQYSGDKQLVERFRREARAASRVGHPHIIDVTDFGTTEDGCAYFVMEHLEGMDLADVLAHEGQLDPARVMRIAVQICRALGAAHGGGIIHRDLKPENVFLVARDGQADFVKVLDFGIARNMSPEAARLTNPGMTMGTPEYMAPEQVLGRPADPRTDVYALGALIYEMLIGGAPFRSATGDTMLDQKMRPLPSLRVQRPEIPAGLDAVVAAALAPDAARRPQTMAALEYELTKLLSGRAQAVTELLGLRDLAALHGETPGLQPKTPAPGGVAAPLPVSKSALPAGPGRPRPEEAGRPRPEEPGRLRPDELEAFLEADLSPAPQVTAVPPLTATLPRRSPPSRAVVSTGNAFGAPGGVGLGPGPALAVAPEVSPRTGARTGDRLAVVDAPAVLASVGRDGSRRVAVVMLLVAAIVSVTWFSRQGRRRQPASVSVAGPQGDGLVQSRSPTTTTARSSTSPTGPGAAAPAVLPLAARGSVPASPTLANARPEPGPPGLRSASSAGPFPSPAATPRGVPEIVPTKPLDRARDAIAAGNADAAIELLRAKPPSTDPAVKAVLIDALVASGTKAIGTFHWGLVARRAREALALVEPGSSSRGAHALLADALFAFNDVEGALAEYQRALAETPGDARLRRHLARARQQAQTRTPVADRAGATSTSGAAATPPGAPSLPSSEPSAE